MNVRRVGQLVQPPCLTLLLLFSPLQWRVDLVLSTLFTSGSFLPTEDMSAKAAINKEVFVPHDEKMLAAVQVKRRTKKKIPFLATGGQGDYMTFICLSGQWSKEILLSVTSVELAFLCVCVRVMVVLLKPKVTFQHILLNFPSNAPTDEHVNISSANETTC